MVPLTLASTNASDSTRLKPKHKGKTNEVLDHLTPTGVNGRNEKHQAYLTNTCSKIIKIKIEKKKCR